MAWECKRIDWQKGLPGRTRGKKKLCMVVIVVITIGLEGAKRKERGFQVIIWGVSHKVGVGGGTTAKKKISIINQKFNLP